MWCSPNDTYVPPPLVTASPVGSQQLSSNQPHRTRPGRHNAAQESRTFLPQDPLQHSLRRVSGQPQEGKQQSLELASLLHRHAHTYTARTLEAVFALEETEDGTGDRSGNASSSMLSMVILRAGVAALRAAGAAAAAAAAAAAFFTGCDVAALSQSSTQILGPETLFLSPPDCTIKLWCGTCKFTCGAG